LGRNIRAYPSVARLILGSGPGQQPRWPRRKRALNRAQAFKAPSNDVRAVGSNVTAFGHSADARSKTSDRVKVVMPTARGELNACFRQFVFTKPVEACWAVEVENVERLSTGNTPQCPRKLCLPSSDLVRIGRGGLKAARDQWSLSYSAARKPRTIFETPHGTSSGLPYTRKCGPLRTDKLC
jgi:hypothetical protein